MLISVLEYIHPHEEKRQDNKIFREKFPWLEHQLTLSKISNLKKDLLEMTKQNNIQVCTMAFAWSSFEKLVLKGYIYKNNRKLVASTCVLLAYKFVQMTTNKQSITT